MQTHNREIYVISDVHLGGEPDPNGRGFRICTHEPELTRFIDYLATVPSPALELVINGDLIDFIAERPPSNPSGWSAFHYPEQNAIEVLDRVVTRSAGVFNALRRFLGQGRRLVILPGNHDIELNLPGVRRRLREHLGGCRGVDYEFIPHGEAYRVGDVLIEHGNRVDDMNFVDYDTLRRLCGFLSRGMAVRDEFLFDPPPGSKLVAEVMNNIKRTYKFIDLLKPETEAAFPVILALEPSRRRDLVKIAKLLAEGKSRRQQQLKRYSTNISAMRALETSESEPSPPDELEQILERNMSQPNLATLSGGSAPSGAVQEISRLGLGRSVASLLFGDRDETWRNRVYNLFDALRAFESADSFNRSLESQAAYLDEAEYLAYGPIRLVIFGHTHLAKQVALKDGGYYFNSGTWADMLELPREILREDRTLAPLAALEQLVEDLVSNNFSRYILFRPTYVRIEQDRAGSSVAQELCDYSE